MSDATVFFKGWNSSSGGWGDGAWDGEAALPGATSAVTSVTVTANANAPVTGLSAVSSVGSVTVTANADVSVTGLSAVSSVGSVLVWGTIVPSQNPGYNTVSPTQTPSYGGVSPTQTPDWNEIAA